MDAKVCFASPDCILTPMVWYTAFHGAITTAFIGFTRELLLKSFTTPITLAFILPSQKFNVLFKISSGLRSPNFLTSVSFTTSSRTVSEDWYALPATICRLYVLNTSASAHLRSALKSVLFGELSNLKSLVQWLSSAILNVLKFTFFTPACCNSCVFKAVIFDWLMLSLGIPTVTTASLSKPMEVFLK